MSPGSLLILVLLVEFAEDLAVKNDSAIELFISLRKRVREALLDLRNLG